MRYFLDTEFVDTGNAINLISIGIVAEDGRELYLCNTECDFSKASPWVWENVLAPLGVEPGPGNGAMRPTDPNLWVNKRQIANRVLEFVDSAPEFWGLYSAHDWVVFTQLWGPLVDKPKHFPWYCKDVVQYWCNELGLFTEDLPVSLESPGNHNAILGARSVKTCWEECEKQARRKAEHGDLCTADYVEEYGFDPRNDIQ